MSKVREFEAVDSVGKKYVIEVWSVVAGTTPTFGGSVPFHRGRLQLPDGTPITKRGVQEYALPDGTILRSSDPNAY